MCVNTSISEFIMERKVVKEDFFFNCFNKAKKTFFAKCCFLDLANVLGSLPGSKRPGEWVNRQKLNVSSSMFLLKERILSN